MARALVDEATIDGVRHALRQLDRTLTPGLSATAAAKQLGYRDCHSTGNFTVDAEGIHQPLRYSADEEPHATLKRLSYNKLQAFDTRTLKGWGVRATCNVAAGTLVVEVMGRCLSSEDAEALPSHEYAVGFDERTLCAKQRLGDSVHYIDCTTHGSLMRLVNDSQEAPNLQLVYWAPPDEQAGVMPRRAFLMARHDVPAGVELTFDYVCAAPRCPLPRDLRHA